MPRRTASHRRSPSPSKVHFRGSCWTSGGGESFSGTRSTSTPEHLSRGQSAFQEALDEAREILGVRGGQSGVVAASVQEAFPAWKTRFSVQDQSANVSDYNKETDQTTPSPPKLASNAGGSSPIYEVGRRGNGVEFSCSVRSNPPRSRNRPEETSREHPDRGETEKHHRVLCPSRSTTPRARARGSFDEHEGMRRRKETSRRVKTVNVEAKRGGSTGKSKSIKLRLKLNNGSSSESSSSDCNASNKGICTDKKTRTAKTGPCRSAPLHQGSRKLSSLKEDPLEYAKETMAAGGYEPLEEWRRPSSEQDNERRCARWQKKHHEPTLGSLTAEGERCFDDGHQEPEPEGEERHVTYGGVSKSRGWNQHYIESSSAEETEEDADDQRRWRDRGRVLWSTHAEPAARARSTGSTRAASHTVRSHSQPATRPYFGLYARSLQANGIDPTNFRASRRGYDGSGLSCAAAQKHLNGFLLWRGSRGDDSFATERTRAPTDGLTDRLEAGRVLDSFNRRAELLGTMPPTPLRAKAAWMETPGDPEYRYGIHTTGGGTL